MGAEIGSRCPHEFQGAVIPRCPEQLQGAVIGQAAADVQIRGHGTARVGARGNTNT